MRQRELKVRKRQKAPEALVDRPLGECTLALLGPRCNGPLPSSSCNAPEGTVATFPSQSSQGHSSLYTLFYGSELNPPFRHYQHQLKFLSLSLLKGKFLGSKHRPGLSTCLKATCYVTLGKSLHCYVPQFPHGGEHLICLIRRL